MALLVGAAGLARAQDIRTSAEFALLEDDETGAVLYAKSADDPMVPASTAKLLTVEIVFHELKEGRLHLDDLFDVSENAWREGGAPSHGSATFLMVHSHVRVEDLLRGVIIQSGNDAAITLAEGLAGTEANFAVLMNKRAAELGMTHSKFANPWGKDDPGQRVTARDMALLAHHIIHDYPEYYHYFSEKDFTWNKIHQLNRNPLLTMDLGADGLKTGDLADSGFGLVGSAVENGQRLILVINGLKTATERAEEARKLLTWGFRSFDSRVVYEAGDVVGAAKVYGGEQSEVPLVAAERVTLFVPRGDAEKIVARIAYRGPLVAPVEANVPVGRLEISRGDMLVVAVPLKTQSAVALGGLASRAFDAGFELAAVLYPPLAGVGQMIARNAARPLHHARGRGRGRQVGAGAPARPAARRPRPDRPAHQGARRLAARGNLARGAARRRGRAVRAGRRGAAVHGGAHRPSRFRHSAGARARRMGGLRPLRGFDARLSGRGGQARPAVHRRPGARRGRREQAGPDA